MKKLIACFLAKSCASLIRLLKMGHASSLPGRIALFVEPRLLELFAQEIKENRGSGNLQIIITGTNGKTTSTGLMQQIAQERGLTICNHRGANLFYGVVTAFIENSHLNGKLKTHSYVIEADEAALKSICQALDPEYLVVTNLYRDQLDRFGELDTTQKMINAAITVCTNLKLVLNADDERVSQLGNQESKYFYSLLNYSISNPDAPQKNSTKKINANISCTLQEQNISYLQLSFKETEKTLFEARLNLPGGYNAYNACAAVAVARLNSFSPEQIKRGLETYHSNFGRSEIKQIGDKKATVFLIKNPAGASEVLKHCAKSSKKASYLICINDNYADGRDVSWLWDADFELLKNAKRIICSGTRASDMALRVKYAQICPNISSQKNINTALKQLCQNSEQEDLFILPTYTALAKVDEIK